MPRQRTRIETPNFVYTITIFRTFAEFHKIPRPDGPDDAVEEGWVGSPEEATALIDVARQKGHTIAVEEGYTSE